MAEGCPLVGLQWDENIPDVCLRQCRGIWERAAKGKPVIDEGPHEVDRLHPNASFEHGGEGLRVGKGVMRSYTVSNNCDECTQEAFTETYTFRCAGAKT